MSITRSRMGRHASVSTATVLNALPEEREDVLALKIVDMFKDPNKHLSYLRSEQFAADILLLGVKVRPLLEQEPRCIFLRSPCYVFGDIHGNLEDLHFFSDNIWRLGMGLTAGNFLFLGDYVDRGLSGLEVVAYLMAMKVLLPGKITAHVYDVMRSQLPTLELDQVFEAKEDLAVAVKQALMSTMERFGFQILQALITDLDPDQRVKDAMNHDLCQGDGGEDNNNVLVYLLVYSVASIGRFLLGTTLFACTTRSPKFSSLSQRRAHIQYRAVVPAPKPGSTAVSPDLKPKTLSIPQPALLLLPFFLSVCCNILPRFSGDAQDDTR